MSGCSTHVYIRTRVHCLANSCAQLQPEIHGNRDQAMKLSQSTKAHMHNLSQRNSSKPDQVARWSTGQCTQVKAAKSRQHQNTQNMETGSMQYIYIVMHSNCIAATNIKIQQWTMNRENAWKLQTATCLKMVTNTRLQPTGQRWKRMQWWNDEVQHKHEDWNQKTMPNVNRDNANVINANNKDHNTQVYKWNIIKDNTVASYKWCRTNMSVASYKLKYKNGDADHSATRWTTMPTWWIQMQSTTVKHANRSQVRQVQIQQASVWRSKSDEIMPKMPTSDHVKCINIHSHG